MASRIGECRLAPECSGASACLLARPSGIETAAGVSSRYCWNQEPARDLILSGEGRGRFCWEAKLPLPSYRIAKSARLGDGNVTSQSIPAVVHCCRDSPLPIRVPRVRHFDRFASGSKERSRNPFRSTSKKLRRLVLPTGSLIGDIATCAVAWYLIKGIYSQ